MYFKVGAIRPFAISNEVKYGKILKANVEDETYLIEELSTKIRYIVDSNDVFIGDD